MHGGPSLTNAQLRASAVSVSDGGGSLTVDGPLTDAQLRASAVPINLTSVTVSGLRLPEVEVSRGNISTYSVLHQFGASRNVTSTLAPITLSGVYQTPTTAQALEVVSSDANDTAAGSGAQEVTVVGLNSSWVEVSQTVATNGTTAVALGTNLIRMTQAYVSKSGTYATTSTGSHAGTITIRASGGGATWCTIPITPFPLGQTQIAAYTVPSGKTAYITEFDAYVDSTKVVDLMLFQRPLADDVTTTYTGVMRVVSEIIGLTSSFERGHRFPCGPYVGPCDLIFVGKVSSGTGSVSIDFDLILVNT